MISNIIHLFPPTGLIPTGMLSYLHPNFFPMCMSYQNCTSSLNPLWESKILQIKFFWANQILFLSLSWTTEKAMAPHSSTLAWKIPWMEELSRLQSMGSLRVGHNWATPLSLFTFMHWRRKWQPTPVFLPGESQGQESLVGRCLWGHTESDTTEAT